ncbi:probable LRR receptor-like serine/threonine-protein kinase At1g05700 isoform X2 [Arachis ipaensis]|uniref:probable LRR receptor-like serine/threonine-protein kinase At1g05700 isoform X2 n=1 Tax=Arachis ipaensis TaxID=130454 RepID=UPI000A2B568F|nr:probable LRR receptor-like serine/threonine-protein kinase At1g05700 isoform X2 [Arachis ipaensis]
MAAPWAFHKSRSILPMWDFTCCNIGILGQIKRFFIPLGSYPPSVCLQGMRWSTIMNVKSNYGIKRNWQGDPCIPLSYMWDGVNCSYAGSSSPRIIYLNLSSSGLTGNIASAISNLKSIGYLDLSNNSLTGSVPYFLSQLHSLKVLNLEGNQLTGAVPMQLRENSNNGMLKTSFGGNQGLCYSGSCSNSNKVVVPLVASLGGGFVILATAITSFLYSKDIEVHDNLLCLV